MGVMVGCKWGWQGTHGGMHRGLTCSACWNMGEGCMWGDAGYTGGDRTNAWGDGGCDAECMWKVVGFIQGSWGCTRE